MHGEVAAGQGRAEWGGAPAAPRRLLLHGCAHPCVCSCPRLHYCGSRAETLVTAIETVCADFARDPSNVHRPVGRLWLAGMNNPNYAATLRAHPALEDVE